MESHSFTNQFFHMKCANFTEKKLQSQIVRVIEINVEYI